MHKCHHDAASSGDSITVELLPAGPGDSLLVRWPGDGREVTMLVDAGPASAYTGISRRLAELPGRRIDYLVLTHVDGDHIEGVIRLVNDAELGMSIGEVWFNGARHLRRMLQPVQGEMLTALIVEREIPWNTTFGGPDAAVRAPEAGTLAARELLGGVRATILAPDGQALRELWDVWSHACLEAGIIPGSSEEGMQALHGRSALLPERRFLGLTPPPNVTELARARSGVDRSVTNASSIVVLLEAGCSQRVLLAGDSTPTVLGSAIDRLLGERGWDALSLSDFKIPHHGSRNSINRDLVVAAPSRRYHLSSDGSGNARHPHDEAIATVLESGPETLELVFNYDNLRNRRWADPRLTEPRGLTVSLPTEHGIESS